MQRSNSHVLSRAWDMVATRPQKALNEIDSFPAPIGNVPKPKTWWDCEETKKKNYKDALRQH